MLIIEFYLIKDLESKSFAFKIINLIYLPFINQITVISFVLAEL